MLKWLTTITLLLSFNTYAMTTEYTVNGERFEGYYLSAGINAPLVIMVHDWDGLTDYEKRRASMLQNQGYSVFAVDLYGKGVRPEKVEDRRALTTALYQNREKMRALMKASISHAASLGGQSQNAIALGYCFGGAVVLEMARAGIPMKSFVSFHGGLNTPDGQSYKNTVGEVVIFHGTADKAVPMKDFASLAEQLENAGIKHEMATYSGAPHAFTVFGSSRYHEQADRKSWQRFNEYLKETL